jgi:hypothetical protein
MLIEALLGPRASLNAARWNQWSIPDGMLTPPKDPLE